MKRKDIVKELTKLGGTVRRQGAGHEVWDVHGVAISIPRHREIAEGTAKKIISEARLAHSEGTEA